MLVVYGYPSIAQHTFNHFLSPDDFTYKIDSETFTFLTKLDFENARKYKELIEVKSRRNSILTQQRHYRGDIHGKAAWRKRGNLNHPTNTRRYNGVSSSVKKWNNGRIPYILGSDYTPRERAVLARAFQEYQSRTCIRFVPKTESDIDFLYIGKIDGCYSDVGRAGGRQELSLDDGCLHLDTVIHELMHSVGFYHEHERWDRDNYLIILWQNIDREAVDQFGRVDLLESSVYGQNYDYSSIMHYDSLAFSRNGRETLVAREPEMTKVMGSATDFSQTDLAKIRGMYQCIVSFCKKFDILKCRTF
uniref:Metalloendopeptidase n=1 Tax=Meloidogyne incognita TaxID=6306 RepID=A0A914KHE6_MELIC